MTESLTPTPADAGQQSLLREQARRLMERLIEAYPAAFFPLSERRIPPLKRGIHKELAPVIKEWGFESAALRYALGGYTRQLRYQMALLKAAQRLNLQGEPVGEISEAHRLTAQQRVEAIQAKRRQNAPAAKKPRASSEKAAQKPRTEQRAPAPEPISEAAIAALQQKLSRKAAL